MSKTANAARLIVALIFIGLIGFGLYFAGSEIVSFLKSIEADAAALVVAIVLSAFLIGNAVRRAGVTASTGRVLAERKADAYENVVAAIVSQAAVNPAVAIGEWEKAAKKVALWGSPGAIARFQEVRASIDGADAADPGHHAAVEPLLREIRQDLGVANIALKPGQLAGLVPAPAVTVRTGH